MGEAVDQGAAVAPNDDQSAIRFQDPCGFMHELPCALRALLVQELATDRPVDARIGKRQMERVAARHGDIILPGGAAGQFVKIDTDDLPAPRGQRLDHQSRAAGDVKDGAGRAVYGSEHHFLLAEKIGMKPVAVGAGIRAAVLVAERSIEPVRFGVGSQSRRGRRHPFVSSCPGRAFAAKRALSEFWIRPLDIAYPVAPSNRLGRLPCHAPAMPPAVEKETPDPIGGDRHRNGINHDQRQIVAIDADCGEGMKSDHEPDRQACEKQSVFAAPRGKPGDGDKADEAGNAPIFRNENGAPGKRGADEAVFDRMRHDLGADQIGQHGVAACRWRPGPCA